MARKIIFAILLILKLTGVFNLNINEAAESNKKRKRDIVTLFSVNEEYAPEDILKDTMDKVSERVKRSIERERNTYGMTLTGGKGVVWNDFHDNTIFYDVGKSQNKIVQKTRNNDETIDKQIQAFRNSITEPPLRGNFKYRRPNLTTTTMKPSTAKQITKTSRGNFKYGRPNLTTTTTTNLINQKPSTVKPITKIQRGNLKYKRSNLTTTTKTLINQKRSAVKPPTKTLINRNPIAKGPSTTRPIVVQSTTKAPSITKTSIAEPKIEKFKSDLDKTYGMSLTGSQGNVWNDINKSQVSYHVQGEISPLSKINKDYEITSEKDKIEEEPKPNLNIKELVTNEPQTEPCTGEPAIYKPVNEEPKTNKPILIGTTTEKKINKPIIEATNKKEDEQAKTYGMILSRDHGIVWNDLNGYRVSYHVGEPDDDIEEDKLNTENDIDNDIDDILAKPINIDDKKIDYDLVNDVNIFNETNHIFTEPPEEINKCENDTSSTVDNYKIIDVVKEILVNETVKLKYELKDWIREEMAKQIEEYLATHSEVKPTNISSNYNNGTDIIVPKEENLDEIQSKKRKDCDEKKEKEPPSKIIANNIYGNTLGNGNVTNIFIFNINNGSDIRNIEPPISNETGNTNITNHQNPDNEENKQEEQETDGTTNAQETLKPNEEKDTDETTGNPETTDSIHQLEQDISHETGIKDDLNEHESIGDSTTKNPNESTSEITEANENTNTTDDNVTTTNDTIETANHPIILGEPSDNTEEPNENEEKLNENLEKPNENIEKLTESVEKPIENAEEPYDNAEKQNENAEEPNENVEDANEHSEEPSENVGEPNGNAEEPNESTKEPNGNAVKPNHNAEEPNENAEDINENAHESNVYPEELNENAEEPNENAEEPNENVDEPNEHSEKPSENLGEPNENAEEPNESTKEPNGNAQKPNHNAEEPNENAEDINENAQKPNEYPEELNENAEEPNENAEEPNENVDEPNEHSEKPSENVGEPNENVDEPNENGEEPNKNVENPNENAEINENTARPNENIEEPNEATELPDIDPRTKFEK